MKEGYKLVVLGDSLVGDGEVKGAFTKALEEAGLSFEAVGRKGWTVKKYLQELARDDAFKGVDFDDAAVIVVLGTNDSVSESPGEFAANLHGLVYALKQRGAKGALWVTPTGYAPKWFDSASEAAKARGVMVLRPSKRAQSSYTTSAMHPSVSQHKAFAGEVALPIKAVKWTGFAARAARIAAGIGAAGVVWWLVKK